MRQISIKALGKRLSIEMQDLPFAVTKYGKIVGVMDAVENQYVAETIYDIPGVQGEAIYCIAEGTPGAFDYLKIGYTDGRLRLRLSGLQVGNPRQLVCLWGCPGDRKMEKKLHSLLSAHRVMGEWFNCNDEVCALLDAFFHNIPGRIYNKPKAKNGTDKIRDIESKGTDSGTKQDKTTQKGTDKLNTAKQQLSKIVDKKKKVTTSKANIHTGGGFFNPQPKA